MTLAIVSEDRNALPTALLAPAKQHMRIDFADDDALITAKIAQAIASFQEKKNVTVNPSVFTWTPAAAAFVEDAATLPVRPVTAIVVTDKGQDPPANVSSSYAVQLKYDAAYGAPIQVLAGPSSSSLSIALTAGYADLEKMPDTVRDYVLRHTAHLYEHREILVPDQPYVAPDLAEDLTWWVPHL